MRSLATTMQSLFADSGGNRGSPEKIPALSVLIIDDNHQYGDLIGVLLADVGHDIAIARDGASGLQLARVTQPDAVLLGTELFDMSGYEVARALRAHGILPATSIIILVSGKPSDQVDEAIGAGANLLLRKPIAPLALPELIGLVHARHQCKAPRPAMSAA